MMSTRIEWPEAREHIVQTYSSWLSDTKLLMADEALARQLQDDRPIALRRKRRSSSSAGNDVQSSIAVDTTQTSSSRPAASKTPKKAKKRVRFSDPGLESNHHGSGATGLTPAVARTSIHTSNLTSIQGRRQRPDRRHSTEAVPSAEYMQFTPMTQQLTPRTKRVLRRNHLSEEMNRIEQDRRHERLGGDEIETLKKQLEAKDQEISRLKEIRAVQAVSELEEECGQLREQLASSQAEEIQDEAAMVDNNDYEIIDGPEMVTASNTRTGSPSKSKRPYTMHAYTQVSLDSEAEIPSMSQEDRSEIEDAKKEKRELFNRLRPHFPLSEFASLSRESSPAPEILSLVAETLLTTKARADDAEHALSALWSELKTLGFPGDGMEAIMDEMKEQFRQARLELERAVPGETAAGFEPVNVLPAMIHHIQDLAVQLHDKEFELRGVQDRHSALSGNFEATLGRLDKAARHITDLEDTIDTGAEEMLSTRMASQRLEKELNEKDVGISRLIAASDKYREEIKSLETLVKRLEDSELNFKTRMDEAVADLECKTTAEANGRRAAETSSSQRAQRIDELESSVQQSKTYASEIEAQLEALKFEKEQVASSMQTRFIQQTEKHESHLGSMNVRISNLATALASANAEVDKLKVIKEKLEKRIREEVDEAHAAMDAMQERQIRNVARNNETKKSYVRKATLRYANGQIDKDEVLEERGPLTPDSAVRFKDYVEVGRGKHRRKYDSGIGILSEEDGEGDDDFSEGDALSAMEVGQPSSPVDH